MSRIIAAAASPSRFSALRLLADIRARSGSWPANHRGGRGARWWSTRVRPRPAALERHDPGNVSTHAVRSRIGGSYPLGGGYSPLEIYGDQTLSLYGPFSAFRVSTAPVLTYTRGYDGQTPRHRGELVLVPEFPRTIAGRLSDRVQLFLRTASDPNPAMGLKRDQLDRPELT